MRSIDILIACLSILGIYGLLLYLRYLFPHHAIPLLSEILNETRLLLEQAEAIGAVPHPSKYTTRLNRSADLFATMRMESNRARGMFHQLRLILLHGLTYKLFTLYCQIEDIKSEIELAVDKQRLAITDGAASLAVADPTVVSATSGASVVETTLPLPAAMS